MLALTGGALIDGKGGEPLAGATVLVGDDGRIAAAGPGAAVAVPEGARQVDVTGKTVLPGLIDCHDHLASFTYDLASRWGYAEPASTRAVRIGRVMEATLRTGYTTVRDCGWLDGGFKAAVNEGIVMAPGSWLRQDPYRQPTGPKTVRLRPATGAPTCQTPIFPTASPTAWTGSAPPSGRTFEWAQT